MHLDLCSFQSIHIDCSFALKTNQTGASSSETIFLLGASPVLHNTANMNSEHFKCTFVDLCNLYAMHIDRTISAFPITANMDFCNLLPSAQCTMHVNLLILSIVTHSGIHFLRHKIGKGPSAVQRFTVLQVHQCAQFLRSRGGAVTV